MGAKECLWQYVVQTDHFFVESAKEANKGLVRVTCVILMNFIFMNLSWKSFGLDALSKLINKNNLVITSSLTIGCRHEY